MSETTGTITAEGRTVSEAIQAAAVALGVDPSQVSARLDTSHFKTSDGRVIPRDTVKIIASAVDTASVSGATDAKAWLVGLLAVLLRDSLPLEGLSAWSARVVGVMLIGIGILHGLAGSSHFFGVLPALGLPDRTSALSYLLAFGAGSIPAMSLFAGFIGGLTLRFAGAAPVLHRGILGLCSFAAICVGGWWLSQ